MQVNFFPESVNKLYSEKILNSRWESNPRPFYIPNESIYVKNQPRNYQGVLVLNTVRMYKKIIVKSLKEHAVSSLLIYEKKLTISKALNCFRVLKENISSGISLHFKAFFALKSTET